MNALQQVLKNKRLLIILLLLLGLIATLIAVRTVQDLRSRAAGENAKVTLPASVSPALNQEFSLPIVIDTDSAPIRGVDIMITFDPARVSLVSITPDAQAATSFKTFTPVNSNNVFDTAKVVTTANQSGKVEFGAITFDTPSQTATSAYTGITQLATLRFKALQSGTTTVSFVAQPGSTTDTNLVRDTSPPQDLITATTQVINTNVTVATPTGVPTPTRTPTPGAPTPTPTSGAVQTIQSPMPGFSYQNKPWTSSETNTFMKTLTNTVISRHGKKNLTNIPQLKGFIYEHMRFGSTDRAWQAVGLDSMHDGAWFGNALTSAYRASKDTQFSNHLNNYTLTFYPSLLNNSDKYFALDLTASQARVLKVADIPSPSDYPNNPVSKGITPYWWDDGESLEFGGTAPGTPLIGYRGGAYMSNHMAQDHAVMLASAYKLTGRQDILTALKNLALGDRRAYANDGGAGSPVAPRVKFWTQKLLPNDTEVKSKFGSLPAPTPVKPFNDPNSAPFNRGRFYSAAYNNTTQEAYTQLDDQMWDYYITALDQDRRALSDQDAKGALYLAYSNIVWNQLWYGDTPRQPGLDRTDSGTSNPRGGEKFVWYKGDMDNEITQGSRASGMNMFFSAVSLQMLRQFPASWERFRNEAFPQDQRVEIRWDKRTIDGNPDSIGYASPITIGTNTTVRLGSSIDTLYLLIDRPAGTTTSFTLYARPDAGMLGGTFTIDGAGNVTAKGRNGTDDLIVTKAIKTANGKDTIELAIPYTIVKAQKPWANAVDDSRLSLKGPNNTVYNLYFLSSPATVKAILEKELIEGLRFWEAVYTKWGMIPNGIRWTGVIWEGFSDSGGYAHIINAAAAYKEYLDGQTNWGLYANP